MPERKEFDRRPTERPKFRLKRWSNARMLGKKRSQRSARWLGQFPAALFGLGLTTTVAGVLATRGASDYPSHLGMAQSGGGGYSIVFVLARTAFFVAPDAGPLLIVGIAALFVFVRMFVVQDSLKDVGLSPLRAALLSVGLLVVMPVPRWTGIVGRSTTELNIYLGQISPNQWHNSTTLAMMPFALLTVTSLARCGYFDGLSRARQVLLPSLYLVLSTLAKPNFTLVAIPALVLWTFLHSHKERLSNLLALTLPATVVILAQFTVVFFHGGLGAGRTILVVDPFVQWNQFSDSLTSSTLRSLVFPVIATGAVFVMRERISAPLQFSWLLLLVAIAQFALLSEQDGYGQTIFHANWSWGGISAAAVLFLFSVREWFAPGKARRPLLGSLVVLAGAFHVLSGIGYLLLILRGRTYIY